MSSVRLLFDFVSPYAYLAWKRRAELGVPVEPVPVLFAGLLAAHGTLGPAEVPVKRAYLLKDVWRKARAAGVPFDLPPAHPFNPLVALRVAGLELDAGARERLVDELFARAWGGGGGVETEAAVAEAARAAGLDGAALVQRAAEPAAKARLRGATDDAVRAGVFGVPTLVVDGELFWGVDALEHAVAFRADGVRPPAALVARWAELPASTVRRR